MIVVDVNIIAYLLIRGERSESMDQLQERDPDWIAPGLWLDEFLNILSLYERKGLLEPAQSTAILNDALDLMEDATYELPPDRILSVARRTGCSAYDSQYIALAEDLGLKLYTCDKGILNSCEHVAIKPE